MRTYYRQGTVWQETLAPILLALILLASDMGFNTLAITLKSNANMLLPEVSLQQVLRGDVGL